MAKHPEDELIDALVRLVALWKTGQRNDGKPRPLEGRLDVQDLDAEVYVVRGVMASPARLPTRPHHYLLGVIEDLIHLGYLRPEDGPPSVTYLHPTMDALFLVDVSTQDAFRVVFHRRYERLRTTRT